jgi:hypothetical protein
MLNNIINSQISHNVNEINRLKYLNDKRVNKLKMNKNNSKETVKYNIVQTNKQQFFKSSNKLELNCNNLENPFQIDEMYQNVNENIKKINNVYKLKYKNADATGFGDFIRGCYFLLEFCERYNIDVDFHIYDSNIKNYLSYFISKPILNDAIAKNTYKFIKINCKFTNEHGIIGYDIDDNNNDFINYLNSQIFYSNNIFINTVNFPTHFINKKHIDYMKTILEPTSVLKIELNELMSKLGVEKNHYITYHIRLGDKYLDNQNETIDYNVLNKIIYKLNIDSNKTYLLLSDSIVLKQILSVRYVNIKVMLNEIVHSIENDDAKIKNTLLDFYLMSNSTQIISFSIYPHGSGFSKWCATTYEIPYICYAV